MNLKNLLSFLVCAALMTSTSLAAAETGEPQEGDPASISQSNDEGATSLIHNSEDPSTDSQSLDSSVSDSDSSECLTQEPAEDLFSSARVSTDTGDSALVEVAFTLENPVTADEAGHISFPEHQMIDFIFPTQIQGTIITRIGAGALQGCTYFKTVTIPATVGEIGANAFADCPHLEMIILAGRADASDLILGNNWCGEATVAYGLSYVDSTEEWAVSDNLTVPERGVDGEFTEGEGNTEAIPPEETVDATASAEPSDDTAADPAQAEETIQSNSPDSPESAMKAPPEEKTTGPFEGASESSAEMTAPPNDGERSEENHLILDEENPEPSESPERKDPIDVLLTENSFEELIQELNTEGDPIGDPPHPTEGESSVDTENPVL